MGTMHDAKAEIQFPVGKTCAKCGTTWQSMMTATGWAEVYRGSGQVAKELATRNAMEFAPAAEAMAQRDFEVLCPKCGEFTDAAMASHFPRGYAHGLMRKYWRSGWWTIVFMVSWSIVLCLVLWWIVALRDIFFFWNIVRWTLLIIFGVAGAVAADASAAQYVVDPATGRIPGTGCRAAILPSTATRTGGFCMPCHKKRS